MDSVILILCYVAISIIFMKYLTDIWDEIVTWCHGGVEPGAGIETIKYGLLYNWYAATDIRNIYPDGWHIPTNAEINTLMEFLDADGLGADNSAGGNLKETGLVYWDDPNVGADNITGFNGRGAGARNSTTNNFEGILIALNVWLSDEETSSTGYYFQIWNSLATLFMTRDTSTVADLKTMGMSIRPIKDSTTLSDGQTGTYTGNDGKVYRTICIGTQEWLADNLAETKYRDGSDIPIVTDNAAWAALTTGARCAYNNDNNNV